MEEPLLKASIDPLPAPEESKGLTVAQGFLGRHKGADVRVLVNKGIMLPIAKCFECDRKYGKVFAFSKLEMLYFGHPVVLLTCTTFLQLFLEEKGHHCFNQNTHFKVFLSSCLCRHKSLCELGPSFFRVAIVVVNAFLNQHCTVLTGQHDSTS